MDGRGKGGRVTDCWWTHGACRGMDPALFFPERGGDVGAAKAVCAECPVTGPCRDWALAHELSGVWGGTDGRQRRALRTELGLRYEDPSPHYEDPSAHCAVTPPHGTSAGYNRHRRLGETPCELSRLAENESLRRRRAS